MFGCGKVLQASFNLPPQRKPLVSTEAYESVLLVSLSLACPLAFSRALSLLACFSRVSLVCVHARSLLLFIYFGTCLSN